MCHAEGGQITCKVPECNKPIYVESNGIRHPFCGRTCASKYGDYVYPKICKRVGCSRLTFVEQNGRVHPYCRKSCANIDISSSQMNSLSQDGLLVDLETSSVSPARLPMSPMSTNSTIVSSDSCEDFVVIGG